MRFCSNLIVQIFSMMNQQGRKFLLFVAPIFIFGSLELKLVKLEPP
jgi:hypothetical protein